jgi:hypothetical protein
MQAINPAAATIATIADRVTIPCEGWRDEKGARF